MSSNSASISAATLAKRLLPLLCMVSLIGPLAVDMYLPAFPEISRAMNAPGGAVEMTMATYLVGLCIGQIILGPLSDRFGRRMPLILGMLIFAVASIFCALATNIHMLSVGRTLQALGSCTGIVTARAVVRDLCTPLEGAKALSLLMTIVGGGPIVAPLLGSIFLTHFGWTGIFWAMAGYGLLCAGMVALLLRETRDPAHIRPLALGSVLMDYVEVLRHRVFLGYSLACGLITTGLFAYIGGSPFVLMELHGLTASQFSLMFSINAGAFVVAGVLNGHAMRRRSPARLLRRGLLLALVSTVGFSLLAWLGVGSVVLLMASLFLYVSSISYVNPNASALALAGHGARAGTAAAAMGVMQFAAAGAVNAIASAVHDGTARPLATIMLACALGATGFYYLLAHSSEQRDAPKAG